MCILPVKRNTLCKKGEIPKCVFIANAMLRGISFNFLQIISFETSKVKHLYSSQVYLISPTKLIVKTMTFSLLSRLLYRKTGSKRDRRAYIQSKGSCQAWGMTRDANRGWLLARTIYRCVLEVFYPTFLAIIIFTILLNIGQKLCKCKCFGYFIYFLFYLFYYIYFRSIYL